MWMLGIPTLVGAAVFTDVALEIGAEVLDRADERLGCARRQRTEGRTRTPETRQKLELLDIAGLAFAALQRLEDAVRPPQPAPAGGAPAAGFARKKMGQVGGHAHRAGVIVEHDHGPGTHGLPTFWTAVKSMATWRCS